MSGKMKGCVLYNLQSSSQEDLVKYYSERVHKQTRAPVYSRAFPLSTQAAFSLLLVERVPQRALIIYKWLVLH